MRSRIFSGSQVGFESGVKRLAKVPVRTMPQARTAGGAAATQAWCPAHSVSEGCTFVLRASLSRTKVPLVLPSPESISSSANTLGLVTPLRSPVLVAGQVTAPVRVAAAPPHADWREILAKDADRPVVQNLTHVRGGARRHGTPHAYVLKMLDRRNVGVCRAAVHQQEFGPFLPVRVLNLLPRRPAMHGLPEDGPSHPAVDGGEEQV